MDCIEAILGRRSCRSFKNQKVEQEKIITILECGLYAPSPANKQPWEFIVVENPEYNEKLRAAVEQSKEKLAEKSGWAWIPKYKVDFITQAPALIVVVGDPSKNGAEQFLEEPSQGFAHACSAAIQNMLLAAHSMELETLWLSLFEKADARKIFKIDEDKEPIAIICLGYPEYVGQAPPRKSIESKVKFIK
ncbi:nitroreductase family protein [Anaerosolibacter sp.]|uniref:nitroreductase family protein n=1 Tax=Anaerosolibacter sp. TaxID=1872527 RepID=UPI0039EEF3E7